MRQILLAAIALAFLAGAAPTPVVSGAETGLDVQIGQMIMVGFRGLSVTDGHPIARDIRQQKIGGVILFDYDVPSRTYGRNIESPKQLKALTASLQQRAGIPLFVAVDQEGGQNQPPQGKERLSPDPFPEATRNAGRPEENSEAGGAHREDPGRAWHQPELRPRRGPRPEPGEPRHRKAREELLQGVRHGDPPRHRSHRCPSSLRHPDSPEALPGARKRRGGYP